MTKSDPSGEQPAMASSRARKPRWWPFLRRPRRRRRIVGLLGLLLLALGASWSAREDIARSLIAEQLAQNGIEARYDVTAIAPARQTIENLVVGDPARPDLTIERIDVETGFGFGLPEIRRLRVEGARLYGRIGADGLSFGALDPLIFGESEEGFVWPRFDLQLVDARARIESAWGPLGVKAQGTGRLDDGFSGTLAVVGRALAPEGCRVERASLFAALSVRAQIPTLEGPLRLRNLNCAARDVVVERADAQARLELARDLSFASAGAQLDLGPARIGAMRAARIEGRASARQRGARAIGTFAFESASMGGPALKIGRVAIEGKGAFDPRTSTLALDAQAKARLGPPNRALAQALASARGEGEARDGDALARFARLLEARLKRHWAGSSMRADLALDLDPAATRLALRDARWQSREGIALGWAREGAIEMSAGAPTSASLDLEISDALVPLRARVSSAPRGALRLALESGALGTGPDRLRVERFDLRREANGAIAFSGALRADARLGATRGDRIEGLVVPLEGGWMPNKGLALWRGCTVFTAARVSLGDARFADQRVRACPDRSGALLRYVDGRWRLGARIERARLDGHFGEAALTITADALAISSEAGMRGEGLAIRHGGGEGQSRLAIERMEGRFGGPGGADMVGTIAGGSAQLAAAPIDIEGFSARWRLSGDGASIEEARARLSDRAEAARFAPLEALIERVTLADGAVGGLVRLVHPASARVIAELSVRHALDTGTGRARVQIPELRFDSALQPDDLTPLAKGVVALVRGRLRGEGALAWDGAGVTSEGWIATDRLDLAAPFGPVKGIEGRVEFSDLLDLTTRGEQRIKIASINPGVEVFDGVVGFRLERSRLLDITSGRWPFMGGELRLHPVTINLGEREIRRYVLEVIGFDAAVFVAEMDFANLAATGIFDGTVSVVFDEDANGFIESGMLVSRAPGGNLSYVGELSYRDMGAIANFAFQSLRSLDFNQMAVDLDGPLTGEIVTRVQFDGVRQGKGAQRNILTRRLARLPIRFKVNVRAPFYQLMGNLRAIYDPAYVRDPRDLGLIGATQRPAQPASDGTASATRDDQTIQPAESEPLP